MVTRSKGRNRGRIAKTWNGGSYRVGSGTEKSREVFRELMFSERPCYEGLAERWNALVVEMSSDPEAMKRLKVSDEAKALNIAVTDAETMTSKARAIRAALKRLPEIALPSSAAPHREEPE